MSDDRGEPMRRRVGVIGDPVAHSLSPTMHQAALDALGIDAAYELWPTAAAALSDRIASLRAPDVLGASVTVPHKPAVMPLVDTVTPLARRAGAVNTVVNRAGAGHLVGDNTDVHGFATSLAAVCRNASSRSALILGAGGAARAVVLALEAMGVERITVANRGADRAERLAADLQPTPLRVVPADDRTLRAELARASLLINATALGWQADETPLPIDLLAALPANALVVDLTCRDTDLLVAARERGLATLDGLPMLVHQGARAFELWTGQPAPIAVMLAAAEQERDARGAPG